MCIKCVLILVFFSFPKKLIMTHLRHLEIGMDATGRVPGFAISYLTVEK